MPTLAEMFAKSNKPKRGSQTLADMFPGKKPKPKGKTRRFDWWNEPAPEGMMFGKPKPKPKLTVGTPAGTARYVAETMAKIERSQRPTPIQEEVPFRQAYNPLTGKAIPQYAVGENVAQGAPEAFPLSEPSPLAGVIMGLSTMFGGPAGAAVGGRLVSAIPALAPTARGAAAIGRMAGARGAAARTVLGGLRGAAEMPVFTAASEPQALLADPMAWVRSIPEQWKAGLAMGAIGHGVLGEPLGRGVRAKARVAEAQKVGRKVGVSTFRQEPKVGEIWGLADEGNVRVDSVQNRMVLFTRLEDGTQQVRPIAGWSGLKLGERPARPAKPIIAAEPPTGYPDLQRDFSKPAATPEAAAAGAQPPVPHADPVIESALSTLRAKKPNSATAEVVMRDLEKKGYDVVNARDELQNYKDTLREDFVGDAEGYRDARSEAWEAVEDAIDNAELLERAPMPEAAVPEAGTKLPFGMTRNWKAGQKTGQVTFDSELQRDLYDLGSQQHRLMTGAGTRGAKFNPPDPEKVAQARRSAASRLGVSEADVGRKAADVYDDVRAQMKGINEGEARRVDDNVNPRAIELEAEAPAPTPEAAAVGKAEGGKLDAIEARAREKIAAKAKQTKLGATGGIDPIEFAQSAADYATIGAVKIARGAIQLERWTEEMVGEFGEWIRPHIDDLFKQAQAIHAGLPKYAEHAGEVGRINLTRINLPDEGKALINQRVQDMEIEPGWRASVTPQSLASIDEAVRDMGMTLAEAKKLKPGQALNTVDINRLRDLNAYMNVRRREAEWAYRKDPNPQTKQVYKDSVAEWQVTMSATRGTTAEAARTLGSLRRSADATSAVQAAIESGKPPTVIDAAINKLDDIYKDTIPDRVLDALMDLDPTDVAGASRIVRKAMKFSFWDKVDAFRYFNMLSGVKTHARNAIWNASHFASQAVAHPAAVGWDIAISKATGRPREYYMGQIGPSAKAFAKAGVVSPKTLKEAVTKHLQGEAGAFAALPTGLQRALHTIVNGIDIKDAAKFDLSYYEFPDIRVRGKNVPNPMNAPTRLMTAADLIGEEMASSAYVTSRAVRDAMREGLKGDALAGRIQELIENPSKETMEWAVEQSRYLTLKREPGSMLKPLQKAFNIAVPADIPVLGGLRPIRWVLPFIQVPSNIAKVGLEWTPGGFLKGGLEIAKGKPDAALSMAKASIGSAVMAYAATQAAQGRVTGPAPSEAAKRDAFYTSGKKPYSILIGNRWVPYKNFGPVAMPFAIAGGFWSKYEESEDVPETDRLTQGVVAIVRTQIDQSYLSSLSSLVDAIEEPERFGDRLIANMVGQLLPAKGALGSVTDVVDPNLRETRRFADTTGTEAITNRLAAGIPGLSAQLPPRVGGLGQTIRKQPSGPLGLIPEYPGTVSTDPVVAELTRLNIWPGLAGRRLKLKEEKPTKLTREQWIGYQKMIGDASRQTVEEAMAGEDYESLSDVERIALLMPLINTGKEEARKAFKRTQGVLPPAKAIPGFSKGFGFGKLP